MKYWVLLCLVGSLWACEQSAKKVQVEGETVDLRVYETEEINVSQDLIRVFRADGSGNLIEEGFLKNGVKSGAWITYHPAETGIKTLASYIDGKLNGVSFEMDKFNRLIFSINYKEGLSHGRSVKYQANRPVEIFEYKNGELDGLYQRYFEKNGELQMQAEYRNGKQHGFMRQFNTEGDIIMDYTYENGEQVK